MLLTYHYLYVLSRYLRIVPYVLRLTRVLTAVIHLQATALDNMTRIGRTPDNSLDFSTLSIVSMGHNEVCPV